MNILEFFLVAITILLSSLSLSIIFTWILFKGEEDENKKQ